MLMHQIDAKLFERKGKTISNFQKTLPAYQSDLAKELFKNPYNLDFITLAAQSNERDLENAVIANIKKFLLELGTGFAFYGEQYHVKVSNNDYCIDLLFYHTRLHWYVVVELKVTEFIPEFTGKLEFYLTVIDEQLTTEKDEPTIGLLLCRSADELIVEYSLRNKQKPMGVAVYKHNLPKNVQSVLPSVAALKEQLRTGLPVTQEQQKKQKK